MSAIPDLLPIPENTSHISLDQLVLPDPNTGIQYNAADLGKQGNGEKDFWNQYAATPVTLSTELQPVSFDWEKSNADRYVNSGKVKDVGFQPYAGTTMVDGKPYDVNELNYGQVQTWGDVMKNAAGGAFHLAVGSFEQSVESWGHTANALFTWGTGGGWQAGKEALLGTPEELLANNKKQEDIMNKYAIYHTPYGDNHLFSKEFIGDIGQQMGFGLGMGAEILGETLLTAGIGEAFSLFSKGARAVEGGIQTGEKAAKIVSEVAPKTATKAQQVNDLRKMSDLSANRSIMEDIWNGTKRFLPGAQVVEDINKAKDAGVTGMWNLFKAGVPGTIKTFSMANAAKAESMMEGANTYGQLYGDLVAKYQNKHDGQYPAGDDLERIKQTAYGAATDNFIVNTGLLMTMNQLEFGNMFSKFGSAKRLLREAAEEGEKDIFTIAKEGKRIAYQKATGPLSTFRTANEIRKDFGMGTALWQFGAKTLASQGTKFEIAEGIQEVLQNTSDQTFRDYYTNLYDGSKDIKGRSIFSDIAEADFSKGLASQDLVPTTGRNIWESSGGWKTFLMGATTGLFMSPLSNTAMYAQQKGYSLVNKEYKSKLEENKRLQEENRALLNSFYANPAKMLDEHIANTKVQSTGIKDMAAAAQIGDKYTFTNAKQDMFTKAVATAIKTDNYDSFIDHIKEFSDKFKTNEEFEQAFPTLKSKNATPTDMRTYIKSLTDDITAYHNNWQDLKDRYSDIVQPELYRNDPVAYRRAQIQKLALDNSIETLATTDYNATQAIKRAGEIKMEMGSIPGIGIAVNNTFDILGNKEATLHQMALLKQEITTYDALGKDKELTDIKKDAKEQLTHLIVWTVAHDALSAEDITDEEYKKHTQNLNKAFSGYVDSKNKEFNNNSPVITDHRVMDDAFSALGDYMKLNQDHGDYVAALNVLTHLDNFKKMVDRHTDGIYHFERMARQQMDKEFKERADVQTGPVDEDVPDEDTDTTNEYPADPRQAINDHYNGDEISFDVPGLLQNYLNDNPELAKELEILQNQRESMPEALYTQHLNEILDAHFAQDDTNTDTPPDTDTDDEPEIELPKLKILHSQVTIGVPFIHENGSLMTPLEISRLKTGSDARKAVKDRSQKRVVDLLSKVSKGELQDNLSLVVTTIKKGEGFDIKDNPAIHQNGQQYSMQLNLSGIPIGYLTNADYYTFTINGVPKTAKQLTVDDIGKVLEIPENMTPYQALTQFQQDADTASAIQKAIEGKLVDGKVTLSGTELSDILSIIPRLNMDYTETGEAGTPLADLSANLYRNPQGSMVVVSNRIADDGSRVMIQGTLDDLNSGHTLPDNENAGTYSALLSIAGDTRWVQLTPTVYTQDELQPQLDTLTTLLSEKDPTTEQIQAIKDIIHGIFIAIPVYSRENGKKITDTNKKWDIRLEYVEPSPDKEGHLIVATNHVKAPILTLENRDISTPQKLAESIQKVLNQKNRFPGVKITEDSFRHQVPIQATEQDILGMTASVRPNIVKSISLVYGVPASKTNLQEEIEPPIHTITKEELMMATPLPKKNKEEDIKKAVEEVDFDALENNRDDDAVPFKIVPATEPFTAESVEHIDAFTTWVQQNLPQDIISVEDMGILVKNLQDNNITVGQFITHLDALRNVTGGTIQVYKNSPFKYHEAFHAIFRLLLPQAKIDQLLEIAGKEYRITDKKEQQFRNLHPQYAAMDRATLHQTMLEEYMANKFDKWMMDKKVQTSPTIKGFFAHIVDFIKGLWDRLTSSQLHGLFSAINSGQYTQAGLAVNQFTGIQSESVNTPALKVIQVGAQDVETSTGKVKVPRYLSQDVSDQIVSGIVNMFYKAVGDSGEYNKAQELDKILKVYRDTYDTSLPIYKSRARAIEDLGQRAKWMNDLIDLKKTFNDKDALQSLKGAVDFHLNLMGYRQDLEDEENEAIEDEYGPNNTENAHKKKSPMSDYGSLSKFLRGYIGSTSYTLDKDMFGNKELVDGSPIYGSVSANKVYNGLLKVLSNHSSEQKLLERLLEYRNHQGNPETAQFINRLLDEVGFDEELMEPTKNSQLLMQVLKGFNQYETPYLFTQIDKNNRYRISYANTRDAARNQFSQWRDANLALKKRSSTAVNKLIDTISLAGGKDVKITDKPLEVLSQKLSEDIQKQTGIFLHQMYVKYLITAGKDPSVRTLAQQKFLDLYNNVEVIDAKSLSANILTPLQKNQDIFSRETESSDKVSGSTPGSVLLKLATGNAMFDESVNTMSFTNAAKETIYAHGYPNYDFMAISDLNDANRVAELMGTDRNSWLLSDADVRVLLDRKQLKVEQIDGLRSTLRQDDGITYGDYNSREFLANLLGLYDVREQPDTKVVEGNNTFYKVPISIRTIEAKNSIHMVRLPVVKAVTGSKLSAKALDILYGIIEQEFTRIGRVQQEITAGTGSIAGYHTEGKNGISPRGLRFFTAAPMLGDIAGDLESLALQGEDISKHRKQIEEHLQDYWKDQTLELAKEMREQGLISMTGSDMTTIKNILAPNYLEQGMGEELNGKMNLSKKDFGHNLMQVLVNDYLNTVGINQVLFGDEAKNFTDPIDQVKRMAGANAQGPNMSVPFTHKDWGIEHTLETIHHITYRTTPVISSVSGKGIDSDDGQMYCTEKGLRYMLFGLGKLNKVQVDILDRLASGKEVTAAEFFDNGGLKDKGPFNSYKMVYFDGNTYLKCSAIPLFKGLPTYAEDAHILRMKMEDYESRNNTVVFAHPVSVSKAMKSNIAGSIQDIRDNHFNALDAKYMRQQLENPSNKLIITDPSQAKQQIMSEQVDSTPVNFMGVETTAGAVKAAYMSDIAQRIDNNYSTAANSIFTLDDGLIELGKSIDLGQLTPRMAAFMDTMKENLQATGADQQTLGFLETANGGPIYNLNFPSTLEKFTQIFLNYFSRGVVAEKVPGTTLALVSGALGMGKRVKQVISLDSNGQPNEWKVITDAEYRKSPSTYSTAVRFSDDRARTFDGLSEGDYYVDDLRHNAPEYNAAGEIIGRFSEYIRPAHYKEEMSGVSDALQRSFGIRIPSDDKHSYISLRMVDTMPVQYGSVGIFPHELIEISGADFDIDKMFVQFADTYKVGNQRVAYGTADTAKEQFDEYVRYQVANNRQLQEYIKEYYDNDPDVKDLMKSLNLTAGQISELTQQVIDNNRFLLDSEGNDKLFRDTKKELITAFNITAKEYDELQQTLGETRNQIIENGLGSLQLPSTIQEFVAAGGPEKLNNGVLNNRVLAARIAMQSNEHIAEGISSTPTSTGPLTALADQLLAEFIAIRDDESITDKDGIQDIINILSENVGDVNDLLGKVRSYSANKEGSRNIGATANAIQVYSLLNEAGVQLHEGAQFTIDGRTYKGFDRTISEDGVRIFATLSTLLNAMTDNAKERLASRLGLNITALGYVSNMVAMGVPLRTSILLMLQPSVRSYFSQLQKISGGLKSLEEMRISKKNLLKDLIGGLSNKFGLNAVGDQSIFDSIVDPVSSPEMQFDALALLMQIDHISSTLMNVSKVQKLSQGLPTTWEAVDSMNKALSDLGIQYVNGHYIPKANVDAMGDPLPVDVRSVLLHDNKIISKNLQVLAQVQQLAKKVFLEKTPLFEGMTAVTTANMKDMYPSQAEEFGKQLKMDTISFLSIKAYLHMLHQRGQGDTLQSLNHAMIYPSAKEQQVPGYEDVIDIMRRLQSVLTGTNENYLVSKFLMATEAGARGNDKGINTVEANTWARINELQQDRLVSAFSLLYSNNYKDESGAPILTHNDAIALFNYLLVKDGGQFKSGSFIKFIPNYMFRDIMGMTTQVNDLLATTSWDSQKAQDLFGTDPITLMNEFLASYGTHTGNKDFIRTISFPKKPSNQIVRSEDILTVKLLKDTAELETAGFIVGNKKIVFPYSIIAGAYLYTIQDIDGKVPTILPGESVLQGVFATYRKSEFAGSQATFKASGVFGAIPEPTKGTPGPIEYYNEEEEYTGEPGDYPEQYMQDEPIAGVNIISGSSDGLAAALTNPTSIAKGKGTVKRDYPVEYNGKAYIDAEAAYKANKVNDDPLAKKGLIAPENNTLMQDIITAKLQQHPNLVKGITDRGGVAFLEASSHEGFGNRFEGKGTSSAFINNLITAYKRVTNQSVTRDTLLADGYVFTTQDGKRGVLKDNRFIPLQPGTQLQNIPEIVRTYQEPVVSSQPMQELTNLSTYTNHSGGADGSDTQWDRIGKEYGMVRNNHYWHGKKTPTGNVQITNEELEEGWQHVLKANESLNRKPQAYKSLLSRNWLQVRNSSGVYAISTLANNRQVSGGTGWAVQMAIDASKPVHVYDQNKQQWYEYDYTKGQFTESDVPVLTQNFAGIGTREINEAGKQAIRDVYQKTSGRAEDIELLSPEQWKSQLSDIYDQKYVHDGKDKTVWLREALDLRNSLRGTMNDSDIIKKIEECL